MFAGSLRCQTFSHFYIFFSLAFHSFNEATNNPCCRILHPWSFLWSQNVHELLLNFEKTWMDTCFLLWSVEKLIAASAAAASTLSWRHGRDSGILLPQDQQSDLLLNSIQYNNAKKVKYLKSFSEATREIIANSDPFTWWEYMSGKWGFFFKF